MGSIMDSIKHLENKYVVITYNLIKQCNNYELRFYAWIKLWAINKHSAWPGLDTITKELNWKKRTAINRLQNMVKSGRLKVTKREGKSNIYDITWYDQANQSQNGTSAKIAPVLVQKTTLPLVQKLHPNYKKDNYKKETNEDPFFRKLERYEKEASKDTHSHVKNILAKIR